MCRIFALAARDPVAVTPWIRVFADACRRSPEYQGHGWGMAWRGEEEWRAPRSSEEVQEDREPGGGWQRYRTTTPVWEDEPPAIRTRLLLVHARSAFRNEGIVVTNNMPFVSGGLAFAFNGELRDVRLSVPGATGAARLLHLLDSFRASSGGTEAGLRRLDSVVVSRSSYVRALNLVVAEGERLFVHSRYSEDPDYFGMHRARRGQMDLVCSMPLRAEGEDSEVSGVAWDPIPNAYTLEIPPPRSGEPSHQEARACSS